MAEVFSYKNNNALAQNIKLITKFFSPVHLRNSQTDKSEHPKTMQFDI